MFFWLQPMTTQHLKETAPQFIAQTSWQQIFMYVLWLPALIAINLEQAVPIKQLTQKAELKLHTAKRQWMQFTTV